MNAMLRLLFFLFLFPILLSAKKLELVFCTDFSGSTNGLIRQFNSDFYSFINSMPKENSMKIGLIAYGRKNFAKKEGYTKEISPLTKRYDRLIYSLLQLRETTEGADAYIDNALNRAITTSLWSKDTSVQKEIILIGNGGFRAKKIERLLKLAKENYITVRAIYYNTYDAPKEMALWKRTMEKFSMPFEISSNKISPIIYQKNYDPQWLLNTAGKLSETYLYYGKEGKNNFELMDSIDHHMKRIGETAYEERLIFKSSSLYQGMNAHWDLIDLYNNGKLDLAAIDHNYLPELLQGLNDEQLKNIIILKSQFRMQLLEQVTLEQKTIDAFHQRKQLKAEQFLNGKTIGVIWLQWLSTQK